MKDLQLLDLKPVQQANRKRSLEQARGRLLRLHGPRFLFALFSGVLGPLGSLFAALGALLGALGPLLGRSWATLGTLLGALGTLLGRSWHSCGPS